MEDIKPPTIPVELHPLLTDLRRELNQLNTLNCVRHQYQSDFECDKVLARRTTEGATDMYLKHLNDKVKPLFLKLGKELETFHLIRIPDNLTVDEDYISLARRWYSGIYETGVLW